MDILLAVEQDHLVGIAPLVIGLLIVLALIGAVGYGMRLRRLGESRRSDPAPHTPDQPKEYEEGRTSPDEMPRDGRRRYPHEVHDHGSTETESEPVERPPRWNKGSSGGFGSGGPGHTG